MATEPAVGGEGSQRFEMTAAVGAAIIVYALTPPLFLGLFAARLVELVPFWVPGVLTITALVAFLIAQARLEGSQAFALFAFRPPVTSPQQLLLRALADSAYYLFLGLGSYVVLHWASTSVPLAIQIPIFFAGALMAGLLAMSLATPRGRDWAVRNWVVNYGQRTPVGALLAVVGALLVVGAVVTTLFGSLSHILAQHNVIDVRTAAGAVPPVDQFARFFAWHFVDAVPLLDATKTLHWAAPLRYNDVATGILVLVYKLALIIPVIGTMRFYWTYTAQQVRPDEGGARVESQ